MENHLEYLTIENFKSIKQAHFECSKVNVFIGKPNAGKSNILEGISMLGPFYSGVDSTRKKSIDNIFYDKDLSNTIKISTPLLKTIIEYRYDKGTVEISTNGSTSKNHGYSYSASIRTDGGYMSYGGSDSDYAGIQFIKRYIFNDFLENTKLFQKPYLIPPHGSNLNALLLNNRKLINKISKYVSENGFKLKLSTSNNSISIQKEIDEYGIIDFDFTLTADTVKRIIFHLLAIYSNTDSVICLEEPEAHIYTPYIRDIVEAIAEDETNQFFIATHSSSFLVDLLERVPENLRLFVVYFENFETKIKQISDEEISKYLSNGSDFFYHLDELIEA